MTGPIYDRVALRREPDLKPEICALTGGEAIPVAWVSPGQFNIHDDPVDQSAGNYLPVRKTKMGKFTMPLYATPSTGGDDLTSAIIGLREAMPTKIGRLTLGEELSQDHYCGGSHDMPDGQPVYWQERGGEYPDDIDGYCLACAISQAESDAGWCECSVKAALAHPTTREGEKS
jgi:hypothetical protein